MNEKSLFIRNEIVEKGVDLRGVDVMLNGIECQCFD